MRKRIFEAHFVQNVSNLPFDFPTNFGSWGLVGQAFLQVMGLHSFIFLAGFLPSNACATGLPKLNSEKTLPIFEKSVWNKCVFFWPTFSLQPFAISTTKKRTAGKPAQEIEHVQRRCQSKRVVHCPPQLRYRSDPTRLSVNMNFLATP